MKFSLAWTAVFLPIFVNAQSPSSSSSSAAAPSASSSSSNNINVCRSFVMPFSFVDVPQVVVSPGGALAYNPSNITATNGTSVTFVFPQYDLPYVMYLAMVLTTIPPTGASLIPSHNLRSKTPARIWQRATARPPVSIPAYRLASSLPSRSQMTKSVSPHFCHYHFFPAHRLLNYCDSDLFLLQADTALWSRNGWVSTKSRALAPLFFFFYKNKNKN